MGIEILVAVLGSGVFGSFATWLFGRRTANRLVKVNEFKAITDEWDELYKTLSRRVTDLESTLKLERIAHDETRQLLRIALRHIRDIVAWSVGTRTGPIPPAPAALLEHIID